MTDIVIAEASPLDSDARRLLRLSDQFSQALYPPESNHLVDPATLAAEGVQFLLARIDGVAVGCGALRRAPPLGEIKRMFVTGEARGLGVGTAILGALEAAARADGVATLRLETGIHNRAARHLYDRAGFTECGPFAPYAPDKLSVFMEKHLPPV